MNVDSHKYHNLIINTSNLVLHTLRRKPHTYYVNGMSTVYSENQYSHLLPEKRGSLTRQGMFFVRVRNVSCVGGITSVQLPQKGVKGATGWWWFSRWCRNDGAHWTGSPHNATPASPWPDGNLPSLPWWSHGSQCGVWKKCKEKETKWYIMSEMYYDMNWDWDLRSKDEIKN